MSLPAALLLHDARPNTLRLLRLDSLVIPSPFVQYCLQTNQLNRREAVAMGERHADERIQQAGTAIKRRGILRAAGIAMGVVLTGIAAKRAADATPVAALTRDSFVQAEAPSALTTSGPGFETVSPGATNNV